eukprot:scaffold10795_cov193-Alexandrium_tamarense.AAC.7
MRTTKKESLSRRRRTDGGGDEETEITIRDGNFTDLDGLEPTITWENSAYVEDVNIRVSSSLGIGWFVPHVKSLFTDQLQCPYTTPYIHRRAPFHQYGIDLSARTTNLAALPRRIWGRASRIFNDRFALSTRLEMDVQSMDRIDFEIDGEDEENDLKMRMSGSASKNVGGGILKNSARVAFVEFTKGFDNDGNRVTINPRYNLDHQRGDVVMTYDADDTLIQVTASKDDQVVTISQKLNEDNIISPTLSRDGSLSLAWDRKLGDDNSIRTTLNPNRSVEVEWRDAAWTANVNFPMDQADLTGAQVHIKRDVKF